MSDFHVVWTGSDWRQTVHPAPPPLVGAVTVPTPHMRKSRERREAILALLTRRALTVEDVARITRLPPDLCRRVVRRLLRDDQIRRVGWARKGAYLPAAVYQRTATAA